MKLPSIFRNIHQHHHPWQNWPSCNYPKTNSFRDNQNNHILKTVNSVFSDPETPSSSETTTTTSFSTNVSEEFDGESLETVVQSVRSSERLFYEPAGDTSSIAGIKTLKYRMEEESIVMEMESGDPYGDFRRSMEEMVEIHGIKDWDCLEELLGWYLKVNAKKNHCFIVEAFVDVLVHQIAQQQQQTTCNNYSSTSFSSAFSSFSHSSVKRRKS